MNEAPRLNTCLLVATIGCALAPGPGSIDVPAAVVRADTTSFVVQHEAEFGATPLEVYRAIVNDVAEWWDPAHTFSGDSSNLWIDAIPDGCFCESFSNGGGAIHLTVIHADPGKMLRMVGGLGPLQAEAVTGTMTWAFEEEGGKTRLTLPYRVAGSIDGDLGSLAEPVDQVLDGQLQRLSTHVASANP